MIINSAALAEDDRWELVLDCIERGITAGHPETVMQRTVERDGHSLTISGSTYDLDEYDHVYVVGGGNAAGAAALEFESIAGDLVDDGVIVTDANVDTDTITVYEGDHPLPNQEGMRGARAVLDLVDEAGPDDLIVSIVCGGGSAHLSLPDTDIPLADLRDVTEELLESGATIQSINAVRKHLSQLKGGRLAATASPASVCAIVFSDVIGDQLDTISSGPVAPDPTSYDDAATVLRSFKIDPPESIVGHIEQGMAGKKTETPTADDPIFEAVDTHVVANGRTAVDAAASCASEHGYNSVVVSSRVRGEASEIAKDHLAIGEECHLSGVPFEPPVALVSGGETTVTVRGDGKGGPNQEYVLSAALELVESAVPDAEIVVGAVDTDGIDGTTDAAGAIADARTIDDSDRAAAHLANNDAYGYFSKIGRLIRTGDTGTNVNDLRVVLVA